MRPHYKKRNKYEFPTKKYIDLLKDYSGAVLKEKKKNNSGLYPTKLLC